MTDVDILLAAVRAQARVLKLPTVGHDCDPLARQALAEAWPPLQYLRSLLDAELATRAERAIERRLHAARLPAQKTLAQFDWKRAHGLERARVEELGRCAWVPTARNIVLLGPVGTGKTHLATAFGIEAIKRGHHVSFYRASDLVRALTEARDTRVLSRLQERLRRVALLIVDSCGAPRNVKCATESARVRVGAARFPPRTPHYSAANRAQRASSHWRIVAFVRQAARAGSMSPRGRALATAARFISRSTAA